MNELDAEFEAELKTLAPAEPSQRVVSAVLASVAGPTAEHVPVWNWGNYVRWLLPAAGIATVAFIVFGIPLSSPTQKRISLPATAKSALKADQVEIDRRLVANFDAVGTLPGGQPVRFRCAQWMDTVSLRDSADGLVIERTTPRLEIVPVGFETY
ncbi:MAG TPA: hypothetical protein VL793_17320 [Patescibacteria group bacterium]|jgi:hypothetical protein|nr:hypothetical protein [Patescibacteria group bacterium]